MRTLLVLATVTLVAATMPVSADPDNGKVVDRREYDEHGRLIWEFGHMRQNSDLGFAIHYVRERLVSDTSAAMTDCASTAYKIAGWRWTSPYSAKATQHASVFSSAAGTWDTKTGASISGGITSGNDGTAGVQDFKNQIDFVRLGTSSTIAVTTTWYYISSGVAVESDGQYNTRYAWATDGNPNAMDVLNIGTHEIGHTFGLDHPKGSPGSISCLTMYAYGSLGETQKRTLGDGDILGIRAIYGA